MENQIRDESGDKPLVVNMAKARALLDCGNDALYALIHDGELTSYLEGHKRKITFASIERLVAKRVAANSGFQPAANSPPKPTSARRKLKRRRA